jgi:hypothetical protein
MMMTLLLLLMCSRLLLERCLQHPAGTDVPQRPR